MKKFEKPEMEVIVFEAEDMITTSSETRILDEPEENNNSEETTTQISQFDQEQAEDQTVEEGVVQVEEQVGSDEQVVEEVEVLPESSDGM